MGARKNGRNRRNGAEEFEAYYSQLFGGRWKTLKESFTGEPDYAEWRTPGAGKPYYLDSASVLAAASLPLDGSEKILDLCAAPGGKTLVLASLMPKNAELYSNERSAERKRRLSAVVGDCLPPETSARVKVSCSDGALWCRKFGEEFDRILLDVPCSSERHVAADPKYLNSWSRSRIRTVTTEQWALLSSAYRMLVPGGILLYSTCALCPDENDGILARLVEKFRRTGGEFEFIRPEPADVSAFTSAEFPKFTPTEFGVQILPDTAEGAGPIYFSVIRKNMPLGGVHDYGVDR